MQNGWTLTSVSICAQKQSVSPHGINRAYAWLKPFPTALPIGMKSRQPRVNSVRGFEVLTKQGNGHAMHHRSAYARHWFAKRGHLAGPSSDLAQKPSYVECWTHKEWTWQNGKTFDVAMFKSCRTLFQANFTKLSTAGELSKIYAPKDEFFTWKTNRCLPPRRLDAVFARPKCSQAESEDNPHTK